MSKKFRIAIAGASGYAGAELVRLAAAHPYFDIAAVTSEKSAGQSVASVFPNLTGVVQHTFEALAPEALAERADALFLALPHTKSQEPVALCMKAGKLVVDLSADYRLKNVAAYEQWYQTPHTHPALLHEAVYGLPELHRSAIAKAKLVASPGCYPTAAILQLAPLFAKGLVQLDSIVIDAKSGISGAGRSPALPYHFPEAHESLEPYKIGKHRHIPEIEQELSGIMGTPGAVTIAFTPHLVPMNRGILSTAYCKLKTEIKLPELRALYREFYKGERFIRLYEDIVPNPRYIKGSNFCDIGVYADQRAGWVVTVAAVDNLVKGAAGQAIQAMNLMMGLPEETGLTAPGSYP
ncbi:N-acetyl-gamma-glutamyl-phosphate reductase [Nitrospira lenta]|uniref:N-acetyl-gamma-glutamyl-phosphate reductase n=1 Tax=Nitrospira lenta TaxID=1436998 RepID=A0A330L9C9_9BACT|nr:N-acetyl-gamma-glutamyl-phosphate reductase [Nitrospira lenta]SPP66542.1 N-acetyl-gamma-glutamyl-phosphate reductase [Nitrospira lenta]